MPFEIKWEDVEEIIRKTTDIFEKEDPRRTCDAPRIKVDIDWLWLRANEYSSLLHFLFLVFQPIQCGTQFPFRVRFVFEHWRPMPSFVHTFMHQCPIKLNRDETTFSLRVFHNDLGFFF